MRKTTFTAMAALLTASPAYADPPFVFIDGSCTNILVADEILTMECKPQVIQTAVPNGRIGFTFTISKGPAKNDRFMMISFFGDSRKQVHPTADSAVQPIDAVHIDNGPSSGLSPIKIPAVGSCQYTNPNKPPSSLKCSVKTEAGEFTGEFSITRIHYR